MRRFLPLLSLLGFFCTSPILRADGSAFDLAGPKVDVHVKRGEVTLPISQAANLMPGDRLWIHPDLPESQSAHFVLVVAFLRGATNPPPLNWFTRVETWTREAREEGIFVTVPQEAQQALIFLAPETGGDFSTLRKAVHDRPGVFVRAAQDLDAASWDRMRLEAYLTQVRLSSQTDQKALKEHAELAARSLGIKLDHQCFDRPVDQQVSCLSQHTDGMVLDDSNTQALVNQIISGNTSDLMNQISYSHIGGAGMYSPYVGAIVDTVKILSQMHTAHFQYIPALALPSKDTLNLRLNTAPSFRDPKSVVVVGLPPIGPSKMPSLHPSNTAEVQCAQKPGLVFAAEGAPLVFGTELAHDLHIQIDTSKGRVDVPVIADPVKGGLTLTEPMPPLPPGELIAVMRGKWGFDDWEGPRFHLISSSSGKWSLTPDDQTALIVGRDDSLHIQGDSTLCVSEVDLVGRSPIKLTWKSLKPDTMEVAMPMKDATPGPLMLEIHQYGIDKPDTLKLNAYSEAASLDRLTFSAGDHNAVLKGTRLDEVAKATLGNVTWTPASLTRVQDFDQLALHTDNSTEDLEPNNHVSARVQLRDGRELKVAARIDPPRPQVTLLSKGMQDDGTPSPVKLGSLDDLPISGKLVFFIKSLVPQKFPRNQQVEVAGDDGSFKTILSLKDGSLLLEDGRTAMGTVEPLARFGPSAFGPLHARAVSADGIAGDWMPLGTLVRLPGFKDLRCPRSMSKPCILSGNNLFLMDSVAATADFDNAVDVAADFTPAQIAVPHPTNGTLYFKLRDDPDTVQTLVLPVTSMGGTTVPASISAEKPAAESSKSDAGKSDVSKPDAGKPDASKSDTGKSDSRKPEAGKSDASPAGKGNSDTPAKTADSPKARKPE